MMTPEEVETRIIHNERLINNICQHNINIANTLKSIIDLVKMIREEIKESKLNE